MRTSTSTSTFRNAGSSSLGVSNNEREACTPSNPERDGNLLNLYSHEGQGKYPDPYDRHLDQGTIVAPRSFLPSKSLGDSYGGNNSSHNPYPWKNNNQEETENGNDYTGNISNRSGFTNMKGKGRVYGSKGSEMNQVNQGHQQHFSSNNTYHEDERNYTIPSKDDDFESLVKQEQELMQLQMQQDMMEKEYRAKVEQEQSNNNFQLGKDFSKEDFEQAYREVMAEQAALKSIDQTGQMSMTSEFGENGENNTSTRSSLPYCQETDKKDLYQTSNIHQATLVPYKHVNSNAMSSVFSQESNLEEDIRKNQLVQKQGQNTPSKPVHRNSSSMSMNSILDGTGYTERSIYSNDQTNKNNYFEQQDIKEGKDYLRQNQHRNNMSDIFHSETNSSKPLNIPNTANSSHNSSSRSNIFGDTKQHDSYIGGVTGVTGQVESEDYYSIEAAKKRRRSFEPMNPIFKTTSIPPEHLGNPRRCSNYSQNMSEVIGGSTPGQTNRISEASPVTKSGRRYSTQTSSMSGSGLSFPNSNVLSRTVEQTNGSNYSHANPYKYQEQSKQQQQVHDIPISGIHSFPCDTKQNLTSNSSSSGMSSALQMDPLLNVSSTINDGVGMSRSQVANARRRSSGGGIVDNDITDTTSNGVAGVASSRLAEICQTRHENRRSSLTNTSGLMTGILGGPVSTLMNGNIPSAPSPAKTYGKFATDTNTAPFATSSRNLPMQSTSSFYNGGGIAKSVGAGIRNGTSQGYNSDVTSIKVHAPPGGRSSFTLG